MPGSGNRIATDRVESHRSVVVPETLAPRSGELSPSGSAEGLQMRSRPGDPGVYLRLHHRCFTSEFIDLRLAGLHEVQDVVLHVYNRNKRNAPRKLLGFQWMDVP